MASVIPQTSVTVGEPPTQAVLPVAPVVLQKSEAVDGPPTQAEVSVVPVVPQRSESDDGLPTRADEKAVPATPAPPVFTPRFTNRRMLLYGVVFLTALPTLATFFYRSYAQKVRQQQDAAVAADQKARATKEFWDKIQRIELLGNQQGSVAALVAYPKLVTGMPDFQRFGDTNFDTLSGSLKVKLQIESQVTRDLAALNRSNVDADLLSYTDELIVQWASGATVDFGFEQVVSALYEQHIRFDAPGAAALKVFEMASGDDRREQEYQNSQDAIRKITNDWLAQQNEHLALSARVIAREKQTNLLMTERYRMDFK